MNQYLLITVIPNLREVLVFATILVALSAIIYLALVCVREIECDLLRVRKNMIHLISGATILGIFTIFMPTQKEIALIYAANYLAGNDTVKVLPPKILSVINKYLDESLSESK